MTSRIVKTQAELNVALAEKVDYIEIRSERGVWLRVEGNRGNSSVVARENSSVEAWGNSSVEARENSSVEARGNSSVVAWGNSSVEAWGNSSVVAWGASCVRAKGGKSIAAGPNVAVHLFRAGLNVKGGVVIDVTTVETDPAAWCDYHGIEVSKAGVATLYKAVDDNWTTNRGFDYSPGSKPKAPDWVAHNGCGSGLHFGPSPRHAKDYFPSATKFVAVGVKVKDLVVIPGSTAKAKAPAVVRACVEVDINGKTVTR